MFDLPLMLLALLGVTIILGGAAVLTFWPLHPRDKSPRGRSKLDPIRLAHGGTVTKPGKQ